MALKCSDIHTGDRLISWLLQQAVWRSGTDSYLLIMMITETEAADCTARSLLTGTDMSSIQGELHYLKTDQDTDCA